MNDLAIHTGLALFAGGGGPDVIYASQSLSVYPASPAHHLQMDTSFSDAILSWSYFSRQMRHLNIDVIA